MDEYRDAPDQDLLDQYEVEDLLRPLPAFRPAVRQYASAARRSLSAELERERVTMPRFPLEPLGVDPADDPAGPMAPFPGGGLVDEPPIEAGGAFPYRHTSSPEPSDPLGSALEAQESEDEDEQTCRVCLTGDDPLADDGDGGQLGPLIAPCLCSGSMGWIHVGCLNRWRRSTTSPVAAAACPQCGLRYRFTPPPGGSLAVWALHCQPLRLFVAAILVLMLACSTGFLAVSSIQTLGNWSVTRNALETLTAPPPPNYHISLSSTQPLAVITHYGVGRVGDSVNWRRDPLDTVARSNLEAIRLILETKRTDPIWVTPWYGDVFADVDSVELQDVFAPKQLPRKKPSTLARLLSFFTSTSASSPDPLSEPSPTTKEDAHDSHNSTSGYARFFVTEEDAKDDALFWGKGLQTPRPAANFDVDWLSEASMAPDPVSHDPDVRSGQAQAETIPYLRPVAIRHIYTVILIPGLKTSKRVQRQELADRRTLPTNSERQGWRRHLRPLFHLGKASVHGLTLWLTVGNRIMMLILFEGSQALANGLARSAARMLAIYDSHHLRWDGFFLLSRILVLGLIALLRQQFQAAAPLPRIVPGAPVPVRSRTRIWAGWALQVVLAASPALLGPYWADWWGGYPLAAYGRPGVTQELFFVQTLAGSPSFPVIVDTILAPLANISTTVARIRAASTSRWISAPWAVPDTAAAEGIRRLVRALLNPEDPVAQKLPLDVYRKWEDTVDLPVGHVKPWDLVSLVAQNKAENPIPLSVQFQVAIALGAPIVVALALTHTMVILCHSHLWIFWEQIVLSSRRLARGSVRTFVLNPSCRVVRFVRSRLLRWAACAPDRERNHAFAQEEHNADQHRGVDPDLPMQRPEIRERPRQADIQFRFGIIELGLQIAPEPLPVEPEGPDVNPAWMEDFAFQADRLAEERGRPAVVDGIAEPGRLRAAAAAARAAAAADVPPHRARPVVGELLSDLTNLYCSLEIILNHVRMAAVFGPFLPLMIFYARLRKMETKLLLDRQVLDLSTRRG